jgi:peptidoglycan hydrolase-like protein with peptidoglycan-binding domain
MTDDDPVDTSSFPTLYQQDNDSDPSSGWVSYAQGLLTDQGFDPQGVDGIFGPNTAGAVRDFQNWAGCTADAVVGNQTWAALHGQFGAAPGVNRANPHAGGGHGGGGKPHDLSADRIYFSSDPFYSSADDKVHVELVSTHGDPIPAGTIIATLTVNDPSGEVLMENFPADHDLTPVAYVELSSIHVNAEEGTEYVGKFVLDGGAADTRSFTFTKQAP